MIALALLTRLGLFAAVPHPEGFMHLPDSAEYDRLAWNLSAHGAYSLAEAAPWTADLTRTPVYPLFVACCYSIAGHRPVVAVAVQLLFSAVTVLATYAIGKRFFDGTTAMVGAGLLAVDPLSIRYGILLLSETLFTTLFTFSLGGVLAYLRRPQPRWVAALPVLTGLAILCRPIAVLWPFALLAVFGWMARRKRKWRLLVHYGLFLAGTFALVSAWVVRNYRVGGVAVLSTVQGINLYYYRAALTLAGEQNLDLADAQQLLRERLQQKVKEEQLDYSQEYSLMERWGWEISGSAPKSYLRAHLQGIARMFLPQQRRELLLGLPSYALFWTEGIFLALLYGLALAGLVAGFCGSDRLACLLLGGVVLYFACVSGPEAYSRFRVPLIPALALLAGTGVAWIKRLVQERRKAFA